MCIPNRIRICTKLGRFAARHFFPASSVKRSRLLSLQIGRYLLEVCSGLKSIKDRENSICNQTFKLDFFGRTPFISFPAPQKLGTHPISRCLLVDGLDLTSLMVPVGSVMEVQMAED